MEEYVILADKLDDPGATAMTTLTNWKAEPGIYADVPVLLARFYTSCWDVALKVYGLLA